MSQGYSSDAVRGFLEQAAICLPEIRQGISSFVENAQPGNESSEGLVASSRLAGMLCEASSLDGMAVLQEVHERTKAIHFSLEALLSHETPTDELQGIETAIRLLAELDELEFALGLVDPDQVSDNAVESEEIPEDSPDAELLEVYSMEAEDHLRSITSGLSILEREPENRETLQDVRRSVHTLKGAANVVGLRTIGGLAHRMEDLLDFLYERAERVSEEAFSALLAGTELLELMGKEPAESIQAPLEEVLVRIDKLLPGTDGSQQVGHQFINGPSANERAVVAAEEPAAARSNVKVIRVPLPRLDSLVKLASELIINRSVLEQRIRDLEKQVEELQRNSDRLRNVSSRLEGDYAVSALGGLRPFSASGVQAPPNGHGFDVLEFDRYTKFHQMTRELDEATTDTGDVASELGGFLGDFDNVLSRQRSLTNELQNGLLKVRMLPFRVLSTRLQRTVRVTADQEEKKADFVMEGGNVEMDTMVIEQIVDPILHLLRNAVAHGIESSETRVSAGKPERATITLRAFQENSNIVIEVADDGRGLDFEAIRRKAVVVGYVPSADAAAALTEKELHRLIFLPGFSTARAVNDVAGRGVGLDVVQDTVRKLHGVLTVQSTPGAGVTFTLRLPLTLTIAKALLIETDGRTFAVPLNMVSQLLRVEREQIETVGETEVLRQGGKTYPLFQLRHTLRFGHAGQYALRPVIVIARLPEGEVAVAVDSVRNGQEIVIKSLGSHLRHVHGILGATLLGDGRIVPILNLNELLMDETARPGAGASDRIAAPHKTASVMIVDDSPSIRRVNSTLIEREGWTPVTAKDGLDALEQLHRMTELPRAILLDVEMPRMDGYELLAALRSEPAYQNVPVVMITSRSGEKHRRKALDLGATEYVTKPYQEQSLLKRLRHLVN